MILYNFVKYKNFYSKPLVQRAELNLVGLRGKTKPRTEPQESPTKPEQKRSG